MAKNVITILCPSGHRRKAQMTPNSNLLQVVEDMCNQEGLDSAEWGLVHQRNKCDLTLPWRLSRIPTNALLEMYKLEQRRPSGDITVQLQLPDGTRYTGLFEPTVTLQEMLDWYRIQEDSMVAAIDISMGSTDQTCPACTYMSDEIIGDYALSNTTLRELGLTSGSAVIRYYHRTTTNDELKKINDRIDDKIVRRRQQKQQTATNPTPPAPLSAPVVPPPSRSLINTTPPQQSNNEEYSIFRDPPVSTTSRRTTTGQDYHQTPTLAEALGIDISLDPQPMQRQRRQEPQIDFRSFKFPEASKGQDLYQNELDNTDRQAQNVKPCNRHALAYDLNKIRPAKASQNDASEELPDSFFELTPDDLRSVLTSLRRQSTDDGPLETRSMRGRVQSAPTIVYEHVAIRFVVNSRHILQALFRPGEPVSRLVEFVHANLKCPHLEQPEFYLYTSPPRVELADLKKPLSAYDLAPAAYVHLGHRKVSPLVVQLASNVPLRTIDEANQVAAQHVFSQTTTTTAAASSSSGSRVGNAALNNRPTSATSSLPNQTARRNPAAPSSSDKEINEKLRKFLPGRK